MAIKFDATITAGNVLQAGVILAGALGSVLMAWMTLTRADDQIRSTIEAATSARLAADAIHDLKITELQSGVGAVHDLDAKIDDLNGRFIRLETQSMAIERAVQRVESKLDDLAQ